MPVNYIIIASTMVLLPAGIMLLQRHRGHFRRKLPRVFELRDLVAGSKSPRAFFQNFELSLKEIPQKLVRFCELEAQLQVLDPQAWAFLKAEAAPLLLAKQKERG